MSIIYEAERVGSINLIPMVPAYRRGLNMPSRDDKRRQQIAKLRAKGMTFAQVGAKLGVTGDCIAKTARSMGLQGKIKLAVDMRGKGRINKNTSRN